MSLFLVYLHSIEDECLDDGHGYSPKSLFSWLTRVMYNRRSKFNPLWNVVAIGGFYKGERLVAGPRANNNKTDMFVNLVIQ